MNYLPLKCQIFPFDVIYSKASWVGYSYSGNFSVSSVLVLSRLADWSVMTFSEKAVNLT